MKAHFIGICGAGMAAIAKLMIEYGWEVSGSDEGFYPPVSTYLGQHNIPIIKGYSKDNITKDIDLIVIGKHAKLIPESNEEVKYAFDSGIKIKSFPEVLSDLTLNRENIVVAGSFGKSTCSALIAWCLEYSKKDPGYFIGAIPVTPKDSSKKGNGNYFVIEGDEYPSANWSDDSKFLFYHPNHLLVTSLTHDHTNIFKTHEEYKNPFRKLFKLIPNNDGLIVACRDGEDLVTELKSFNNVVWYSVKGEAQWGISDFIPGEISSFNITKDKEVIGNIKTNLLGIHNVENILGAGALLLSLNAISPKEFSKAIELFQAPDRRLNKKSNKTTLPIFEGFGSSYAKAVSAIEAMKLHFGSKKLIVIFEPHTFSWRDRNSISWYDSVFNKADSVFIYKPPDHGKDTISQLSLDEIVSRVEANNSNVIGFDSVNSGIELISKSIHDDSAILILSSGSFDGLIDMVVEYVNKNFPV